MTTSLSQEQAKELFDYRDGVLYWKIRPKNSRKHKNDFEAGTYSEGYKKIRFMQKTYYVHQLVYLIHFGFIPKLIDHIDGNKSNNRIDNLREVSKSHNACNSKMRSDNTSGHRSVIWHKKAKKWMVQIQKNMKSIYIGLYADLELACLVANEARSLYHGKYARF